MPLFSRRDVGANTAEPASTFLGTEAARGLLLLLKLDHPQVMLGLPLLAVMIVFASYRL